MIAVDIVPEKVEMIKNWKSPIQDEYIEKYLAEHEERGLKLTATTDGEKAYSYADIVIIAAPTNYDAQKNFFDLRRKKYTVEREQLAEEILKDLYETEGKVLRDDICNADQPISLYDAYHEYHYGIFADA